MKDAEKKIRAKQELDVLEGVISYAERMIYEEGNRVEYSPLRRHAYGKTVVINTEYEGRQTFRLSSTSAVYPNRASGYATPYSPVGRFCAVAKPGETGNSARWGNYKVSEIRLFDRFDGAKFEANVRNFLRMDVQQRTKRDEVFDLRAFLQALEMRETAPLKAKVQKTKEQIPGNQGIDAVDSQIETPSPPNLKITEYSVDEGDDIDQWDAMEDDDEIEVTSPTTADEYFGLSEMFYVDRTRQQDRIISRSPIGAMYVEGIAGSGKTSAALGRTKMLCDFNARNAVDESELRAVIGEDGAHWSKNFAGQFSQESSIGFVRTGELIQYLKETCRRLDLPNLPVQEFPELRSRLRQLRQLGRAQKGEPRWKGLDTSRGTLVDTSMAWLSAVDSALAHYWARLLVERLTKIEDVTRAFKTEVQKSAQEIAKPAVNHIREQVEKICADLNRPRNSERFALDGLANRLNTCIDSTLSIVLGSNSCWINIGSRYLQAMSERALAELLIADNVPLYTQKPARLVFLNGNRLTNPTLEILDSFGNVISAPEVLPRLRDRSDYFVRDTSTGETLPANFSDGDSLYLSLLPESANKIYIRQGERLKPLTVKRGLGHLKLPIKTTKKKQSLDTGPAENPVVQEEQRRSIRAVFKAELQSALLRPLLFIADAYLSALQDSMSTFPDTSVAKQIIRQLENRQLADEDVDLLLCVYHLVARGFEGKGQLQPLAAPSYYQSVFIDEVQDFTEQQIYLMAEQARPEYFAVTAVGDPAQKLHNGGRIDVRSCFPGRALANVKLTRNMRQANVPRIAWFSAKFREEVQGNIINSDEGDKAVFYEPVSNTRDAGPELIKYSQESDLVHHTVSLLESVRNAETAAVILPNEQLAERHFKACKPRLASEMIDAELSERIDLSRRHVKHFTSVMNAKGLEFDFVILPYLELYDLANIRHQNCLYVALTRAMRRLVMISHADKTPLAIDQIWGKHQEQF